MDKKWIEELEQYKDCYGQILLGTTMVLEINAEEPNRQCSPGSSHMNGQRDW